MTILYEGLVLDGTLLPPVIFSNCPEIPDDITEGREAVVIYYPNLQAPSADTTQRWIDSIRPYLEDSPVVIHDRGPEFVARSVQEEFEALDIQTLILPATGGAFANPCDNAFNSSLRRIYAKQPPETYPDKLIRIIDSYYAASEESIKSYFEHIGYCGKYPSRKKIENLLNEGYKPSCESAMIYRAMKNKFCAWKQGLRSAKVVPEEARGWKSGRDTWVVIKRES